MLATSVEGPWGTRADPVLAAPTTEQPWGRSITRNGVVKTRGVSTVYKGHPAARWNSASEGRGAEQTPVERQGERE